MKKLFVSLLMMSVMLTQSTVGLAALGPSSTTGNSTLSYNVDASYSVTIPASPVIITGATGASGSTSGVQNVTLAANARITNGQTLKVMVGTATPTLRIGSNGPTVPTETYLKKNGASTETKMTTTEVLTAAAGTTTAVTSAIRWQTTAAATIAGTYTTEVTFTVTMAA